MKNYVQEASGFTTDVDRPNYGQSNDPWQAFIDNEIESIGELKAIALVVDQGKKAAFLQGEITRREKVLLQMQSLR